MSADGEQGGAYPQSKAFRDSLSHQQQMFDAQHQCVPCKLCGGHAVISDAGTGNGYYINCSNYSSFQSSRVCMIDQQRLGGWAYNVMDWWNRLHAVAAPLTEAPEVLSKALDQCQGIESGPNGQGGMRVVVHFKGGGDEYPLFSLLNAALAQHSTSPEDAA